MFYCERIIFICILLLSLVFSVVSWYNNAYMQTTCETSALYFERLFVFGLHFYFFRYGTDCNIFKFISRLHLKNFSTKPYSKLSLNLWLNQCRKTLYEVVELFLIYYQFISHTPFYQDPLLFECFGRFSNLPRNWPLQFRYIRVFFKYSSRSSWFWFWIISPPLFRKTD